MKTVYYDQYLIKCQLKFVILNKKNYFLENFQLKQ